MIERIPDLPDNVLGFTAKGKVTADDYEAVIIPAVEALFERQQKVRFLYHLGNGFEGFEPGAMWDDAKLGLRHLAGWERVALVSDVEWLRTAVQVFAFAISGQVRVFSNRELAEAARWVTE
jgi:hypothetical protein